MAIVRIKLRGDTAANLAASNPLLGAREIALETDTGFGKFGDGVRRWNAIPEYHIAPTSVIGRSLMGAASGADARTLLGAEVAGSASAVQAAAAADATSKANAVNTALYLSLASNPDALIVGTITRDGNGAATAAGVVWPDGTTGDYTALVVSTEFPGAVDSYEVTYGSQTYTQPTVTRDVNGAVTVRPAITVT
jgi:hypothetical protein